nr:MAG TPA: hypothetical protein [Caudoviricetes sp.]
MLPNISLIFILYLPTTTKMFGSEVMNRYKVKIYIYYFC